MTPGILVTDFDGTITRRDFFDLVRERWPQRKDPWDDYVAGRLTHFEALRRIFSSIRCPESELLRVLDEMELDPFFFDAVRRLKKAGWRIIVASAGCGWYIEKLLKPVRAEVEIRANPGRFVPDAGLEVLRPPAGDCVCEETGVDKLCIVQQALKLSNRVAFAGDGRPDLAPSLLVPPERRFARGWLAGALRERNECSVEWTSWKNLADSLLEVDSKDSAALFSGQ